MEQFLNHYTSVMHAKNLLTNLKKNYDIKNAFLDYCRRAERDQLHERDGETFEFVVKCFFLWHMASQLRNHANEILEQWSKDLDASDEAYKADVNYAYKLWYEHCYEIKRKCLMNFMVAV